jgi:hypothetical protein
METGQVTYLTVDDTSLWAEVLALGAVHLLFPHAIQASPNRVAWAVSDLGELRAFRDSASEILEKQLLHMLTEVPF